MKWHSHSESTKTLLEAEAPKAHLQALFTLESRRQPGTAWGAACSAESDKGKAGHSTLSWASSCQSEVLRGGLWPELWTTATSRTKQLNHCPGQGMLLRGGTHVPTQHNHTHNPAVSTQGRAGVRGQWKPPLVLDYTHGSLCEWSYFITNTYGKTGNNLFSVFCKKTMYRATGMNTHR